MKKYNVQFYLLSGLIIFHILSNFVWMELDTTPLPWDPANHTIIAVDLRKCLVNSELLGKFNCIRVSTFYPILIHSIAAFMMLILGVNVELTQLTGTLFLILLIVAVYLWAFELSKSRFIALGTSGMVTFLPVIFDASRFLWLDIPLTAFSYMAMFYLLKSYGFKERRESALAFVFLGLSLMTKWYAWVNLFIPFLFAFLIQFKRDEPKKVLQTAVLGTFIVFLIIAPWYVANLKTFIYYMTAYIGPDLSEPAKILSLENIRWYLSTIVNYELGFWPFLVFLASGIHFFIGKNRGRFFVSAFLLFNYFAYTSISNKDYRYTFHLLPVLCFVISYGVYQVYKKSKAVGWATAGAAFIYFLFFYFEMSFRVPFNIEFVKRKELPGLGWTTLANISDYPARSVKSDVWPNDDIIFDLMSLSGGKPVKVQVLVEYPQINSTNILLSLKAQNADKMIILNDDLPFGIKGGFASDDEIRSYIKSKDYFLVAEQQASPDYYLFHNLIDGIQRIVMLEEPTLVKRMLTYKIPHSEVYKYLKDSDLGHVSSTRDEECSKRVCDKVILYQVVK